VAKKTKKPAFATKLYSFDEVMILTRQAVKVAIAEFKRIYDDDMRVLAESKLPRGRGRPKKEGEPTLYGFSFEKKKKTVGRPVRYKNPHENIAEWDLARARLAIKLGKKSITDLQLVMHMANNDTTLSRIEKNECIKEVRSTIKQLRDKTGVRIHKRKKAENPLN